LRGRIPLGVRGEKRYSIVAVMSTTCSAVGCISSRSRTPRRKAIEARGRQLGEPRRR
jgi:hypothetical protein